ncbi:MAG: hypothetical protein M3P18_09805 [Actinomycetota bacterium]|nr:hypothetical protein [Actinomycetota bacterium]
MTIWPHGWSFGTFLAVLAVLSFAAIAGGAVGTYEYMHGWNDAQAVHAPHHTPTHAQGGHR